jgi:short-subunit dehydrogenase
MSDMPFTGKCIWITGASSGIGEALARTFAEQGASLLLSSRRPAELERVRLTCDHPERHQILELDLERSQDFPALAREAVARMGRIDLLINNGGVSQRGLAADTPPEVERRLLEIGYFGPVFLTKALLPHFLSRGSGRIVVISSVMGYVGTPMRSSYSAAKHALHGYFDSLRAELWRSGIGVTLACPGYVRTAVSENALLANGERQGRQDRPKGRGIGAPACAAAIVRAVAREKDEIHVGGKEVWGIRLKRWFPGLFARLVRRMDFGQGKNR